MPARDAPSTEQPETTLLYEHLIRIAYETLLRPGDLAADAGANVGVHTLPMSRAVQPGGLVLAFEPIPHFYLLLIEASLQPACSGSFEVFPYALSDRQDDASFFINNDNGGFCSGLAMNPHVAQSSYEPVPVRTYPLDAVLPQGRPLRFIKIDVEGAEATVVRGGLLTLAQDKPVIAFEAGAFTDGMYASSSRDIFSVLKNLGYRLLNVVGEEISSDEEYIESTIEQKYWNYIAIHETHQDEYALISSRLKAYSSAFDSRLRRENPGGAQITQTNPGEPLVLKGIYDSQLIEMELTNLSSFAWPAETFPGLRGTVRVGMQWYDLDTAAFVTEDRREIPRTVWPGESVSAKVLIGACSLSSGHLLSPGRYRLRIGLVSEHLLWLEEMAEIPVTIV